MRGTLAGIAALLLLSATAAPAQEEELSEAALFRKRLSRYAPAPGRLPKGLCVCQDGSANHGRAGELHTEEVNQVRVNCVIPSYTGNGSFIAFSTCGTFETLAR